jgi:leucyl-tRNA synthetase
VPVWWCDALGTVLANEEVINGRSERGDHPCEKRPMKQWMLQDHRAYAERLLDDLEDLDWPESVKAMQREWIGRSEGRARSTSRRGHAGRARAHACSRRAGHALRRDLHGARARAPAGRHSITTDASSGRRRGVRREGRGAKSDLDRTASTRTRPACSPAPTPGTRSPTDGEAHPDLDRRLRADELRHRRDHGRPGHDERDFEFAQKFDLPIVQVVDARERDAKAARSRASSDAETGGRARSATASPATRSSELSRRPADAEAKQKIIQLARAARPRRGQVNYRLRDWLFSRQRYWGEPIPVLHKSDGGIVPLPEDSLPVLPAGDGRLPPDRRRIRAASGPATDWVETTDPADRREAMRETNTMPQWAGSCWYYLRFIDPRNDEAVRRSGEGKILDARRPLRRRRGARGAAPAVRALLAQGALRPRLRLDQGAVPEAVQPGMILAYSYKDANGAQVHGAISRFVNDATKQMDALSRSQAERFVRILSPFAPHLAEELWQRLGHADTVSKEAWPSFDEKLLVEDEIELAVQVLGKVRAKIQVAKDADKDAILARAREAVAAQLEGKNVVKEIVVPGRLVNFVAK